MTTREHEHTLNVQLAKLLKEYHGLNAKAEQLCEGRRGRIDIEVTIGRVHIAVEAEHGWNSTKEKSAVKDADKRLKDPSNVDCAIAVCYPDNSTLKGLQDSKYKWKVRYKRTKRTHWNEGSLSQLASVIRLAPTQLGDPDSIADSLSYILDSAVGRLDERQKELLAKSLDLPSVKSQSGSKSWNQAAKRSMLVLATAMMFHSRLDNSLEEMIPEKDNRYSPPRVFNDSWPPATVQNCIDSTNPVRKFSKAWNLILALDYKPIFETGKAVINSCSPDYNFTDAVKQTAEAALNIVCNIAGLRHDLLGRIFHTVLNTAKYDGSFYTTTSAATLLSTLAIKSDMCDWNDTDSLGKFRITDPACGTGTLLMAVSERIRDIAKLDSKEVAQTLIEQTISGYDVNLSATHMAATTLGLLSPQTQFRKMKIARVLLGTKEGKAYVGSLEFLDQNQLLIPWPNQLQSTEQVESGKELSTENNSVDVVIMNPPFTRNSLRHDQFSRTEEQRLRQRESKLFNNSPVHLSSNSNSFIVLAEYLNKKSSGATLAAVLPAVTSTNPSALSIRQFLAKHYHIEVVIVSHDPKRIFFSENTNIGEILLVCRRWDKKNSNLPTKIVNLAVNPETPTEAFMLAEGINQGSIKDGTIQEWSSDRIAEGDWSGVKFFSPYLCNQFLELKNSKLFPATEMGNVSEISPDGRGIRGAFDKNNMPGEEGMTALWDHKTEDTQSTRPSKTMNSCTDTYIIPKKNKREQALKLWGKRGRLLLPARIRLNLVRTLSVWVKNKTLGSAWIPCKPNVEDILGNLHCEIIKIEKAFCVYLNSTIGILGLLGNRSNKSLSYPQFSLDGGLRKISVPDFAASARGG